MKIKYNFHLAEVGSAKTATVNNYLIVMGYRFLRSKAEKP